jgi:hypothetical protein
VKHVENEEKTKAEGAKNCKMTIGTFSKPFKQIRVGDGMLQTKAQLLHLDFLFAESKPWKYFYAS